MWCGDVEVNKPIASDGHQRELAAFSYGCCSSVSDAVTPPGFSRLHSAIELALSLARLARSSMIKSLCSMITCSDTVRSECLLLAVFICQVLWISMIRSQWSISSQYDVPLPATKFVDITTCHLWFSCFSKSKHVSMTRSRFTRNRLIGVCSIFKHVLAIVYILDFGGPYMCSTSPVVHSAHIVVSICLYYTHT